MTESFIKARAKRRGKGVLLGMLMALLATSAGHADQYLTFGKALLTVPPPSGFTNAMDDSSADRLKPLVASMSPSRDKPAQLYLTPAELHELDNGADVLPARLFLLAPIDIGVDGDQLKRALSDAGPRQLGRFASRLTQHLSRRFSESALEVQDEGVFRHEPWGLFLSFRVDTPAAGGKPPQTVYFNEAIISVRDQMLALSSVTLADDAAAQTDAENTMSDWADAIRQANPEPVSVKSGTLYRAAPWLILLGLGALAYMLLLRPKGAPGRQLR